VCSVLFVLLFVLAVLLQAPTQAGAWAARSCATCGGRRCCCMWWMPLLLILPTDYLAVREELQDVQTLIL